MTNLIIGASGQLGRSIGNKLKSHTILLSHKDIDVCNFSKLEKLILKIRPKYIFYCAAYHNTYLCEKNIKKTFDINTNVIFEISKTINKIDSKLIYFSTDYVFDGKKRGFYTEICKVNPLNIYGLSKFSAENIIKNYINNFLIVRVSSLYGPYECRAKPNGSFVDQVIRQCVIDKKKEIYVTREKITPTYTEDLTSQLLHIYKKIKNEVVHISSSNGTDWFNFAKFIVKTLNLKTNVKENISLQKEPLFKRPVNSRLRSEILLNSGYYTMPTWQESFKKYIRLKNIN